MRHSNEKIIQNTFLFTASLIIQKIFSFSYFWFISSRLSPEAIGTYTWVLSYGALCSIGMDFGLASILAREAAKDEDRSEMYLRAVYSLKLPLVILTSVALWVVYFFFTAFVRNNRAARYCQYCHCFGCLHSFGLFYSSCPPEFKI